MLNKHFWFELKITVTFIILYTEYKINKSDSEKCNGIDFFLFIFTLTYIIKENVKFQLIKFIVSRIFKFKYFYTN